MRKFLFHTAANISYAGIRVLTFTSHWSLAIQMWLVNWMKRGVAALGVLGMRLADNKRFEYSMRQAEEAQQEAVSGRTLALMSTAVKLRDHAIELGDWTEQHTEAINVVGEALIVEAGWQEEAVHNYLRGVVESIEGLEYGLDEID